jgi:WD40 repeat protein
MSKDGDFERTIHVGSHNPYALAFSPDSTKLASGSEHEKVGLWTIGGDPIRTLDHHGEVNSVAFSPDGNYLASGSDDGTVQVWLQTENRWSSWPTADHEGALGVAFNRTGQVVAVGQRNHTVGLWVVGSPFISAVNVQTLEGHSHMVGFVAFSSDGALLASGSNDGTVRLWYGSDVPYTHKETLGSGGEGRVLGLAFSPDNEWLAATLEDSGVRLWRVSDTTIEHTLRESDGGIAFSPDGNYLATCDGYRVKLWSLKLD